MAGIAVLDEDRLNVSVEIDWGGSRRRRSPWEQSGALTRRIFSHRKELRGHKSQCRAADERCREHVSAKLDHAVMVVRDFWHAAICKSAES